MQLYLGEGSDEYLALIEDAVELWNNALVGFNRTPVISIVKDLSPKNSSIPSGFWRNHKANSSNNIHDGQSVIYFKPDDRQEVTLSFARWRWSDGDALIESDIYMNTTHEEEYGRDLAYTSLIFDNDAEYSPYVIVNSTYITLLHEIGHALGLKHIPVSGNIMSYKYAPGLAELWESAAVSIMITSAALQALGSAFSYSSSFEPDLSSIPFFYHDDMMHPYMVVRDKDMQTFMGLFNKTVKLGEQDKMSLLCNYAFEDWNE